MADIQGVVTLGTGPTTGSDIEHFILMGLNANPVAAVTSAQFTAYLSMDSAYSVPLAMDSSFSANLSMDTSFFAHLDMN